MSETKYSYDEKCEELARYFLPRGTPEAIAELAQVIQDAIEHAIGLFEERSYE